MSLLILGECRPRRWLGCKTSITSAVLDTVIPMLPQYHEQGIVYLTIPGETFTLPSHDRMLQIVAVLAHESNSGIGIMHWKKGDTMILRRHAFEEAIGSGRFGPGMDYPRLIEAIAEQELTAVDIDFESD